VCGCDGEEARLITKHTEQVEVIYLPSYDAEEVREEISLLGPHFILCSVDFLLQFQPPGVERRIDTSHADGHNANGAAGPPRLSDLELTVLAMLSKGLTNDELARTLQLSSRTVKRILKNLFDHLEVTNRTELTGRVAELRLLDTLIEAADSTVAVVSHRAPLARTPAKLD
jgi:DNA-binding NarL/FixJ family response regulator